MLTLDQKICHLTFTHTDCADIWPAYFGETSKYFKTNMAHYACLNQNHADLPSHIQPLIYDASLPYPRRLKSCLEKLEKYDYIFFDHEDMFLYDYPKFELLKDYYEYLKTGKVDHIRLIKGGQHWSMKVKNIPSLHKIMPFSPWVFSIQPSFWKRKKLIEVLNQNLDCNIWELEVKSQKAIKKIGLKVAYSHTNGKQRGLHHFDNDIFPYIATAIGKGKWNYSEYTEELDKVFNEYKIDKNKRGYT